MREMCAGVIKGEKEIWRECRGVDRSRKGSFQKVPRHTAYKEIVYKKRTCRQGRFFLFVMFVSCRSLDRKPLTYKHFNVPFPIRPSIRLLSKHATSYVSSFWLFVFVLVSLLFIS